MDKKRLPILFIFAFLLIIITVSALPDSSTQTSGNRCQTKHSLNYNYNFEYNNNLEIGKIYDLKISFSLKGTEVTTNPHQLNVKIVPVGFELNESSFSLDSSKTIKITPTSENPSLQVETTLVLNGDNPSHRGYEGTYVDNFEITDFVFSSINTNSNNQSSSTNSTNNTNKNTTQVDFDFSLEQPSKAPWYLVRLMGILAFIFLSLSVFISLSKKANYNFSLSIFKYHHDISIFAILFAFLHIINNLLDNYRWSLNLGDLFWFDFSSTARIMISLGVIALYLMIIIVITSLSPKMIGFLKYNNWKRVHLLSYLLYILVIIHSLFIGTDLNLSNLGGISIIAFVILAILTLVNLISFIIFVLRYFNRRNTEVSPINGEVQ